MQTAKARVYDQQEIGDDGVSNVSNLQELADIEEDGEQPGYGELTSISKIITR